MKDTNEREEIVIFISFEDAYFKMDNVITRIYIITQLLFFFSTYDNSVRDFVEKTEISSSRIRNNLSDRKLEHFQHSNICHKNL